jgi:DNA end-binding protein Ku
MAPRANWKGFLRLSLVTCPVALYPATSESEKISFNQLNRQTGHRIKYLKVDADTGDEVPNEDIVKGYKVDTDTFIEVTKEELENVALESTRTIEIDEFVDKADIDPRYLIRPYYLRPDGKVGHDAFAVIRETIRSLDKGGPRARCPHQPRACHRARSTRQGSDGHAAALPLRGPRRVRIF